MQKITDQYSTPFIYIGGKFVGNWSILFKKYSAGIIDKMLDDNILIDSKKTAFCRNSVCAHKIILFLGFDEYEDAIEKCCFFGANFL